MNRHWRPIRSKRFMSDKQNEHTTSQGESGGVRERILEAALTILSEDGISEFSQVQVARRAEIRQSHLTYYFPKRHDLISAVAERVVDEMASGVRRVLSESEEDDGVSMLEQLSDAIGRREHMRMFVGTIVEADRDPKVQAILGRETERLQAALAEALGGENAMKRARLVLASLWGLGLYAFLIGRPAGADASFFARLAGTDAAPQSE